MVGIMELAMAEAIRSEMQTGRITVGLLAATAVILLSWTLRASYVVTMPLAFAILVAVLVQPVRKRAAARLPDPLEMARRGRGDGAGPSGAPSPRRC